MKVKITSVDYRLRSNLILEKTISFTEKSSSYTILGFTRSLSQVLGDNDGYIQLLPATYKSDKPNSTTGTDKVHLKCDCVKGSILNGVRENVLYTFCVHKHPGHEIKKEPTVKVFRKVKKSVLSLIPFYLDDDHKPVDFNGGTISFKCQLVNI